MQAGKLRHYIKIESPVYSTNQYNEREVSRWDEFCEAWAEVSPPKGREYFSSDQTQASVVQRVRIRWVNGITPAMRVNFNDRIFHINSVINPDERNRELILMCTEEV